MTGLRDLVKYFRYFYRKLGNGFFILIGLFVASGYFNGFGIALLLPILSLEKDSGLHRATIMSDFFQFIGVEFNLTNLLILFAVTFLIKGFFQFLQDWFRVSLVIDFTNRLQKNLADNYSRLNFGFYSKTQSGFFTNIFTTETGNLTGALHSYITALGAGLNSVVLFAFAIAINMKITIAALVAGGLVFASTSGLRKRVTELSRRIAQANGSVVHGFIQFIMGFKYLKSIEGHFKYSDRINAELDLRKKIQIDHSRFKALANALYEPVIVVILCIIIYFLTVRGGQAITVIAVPLLLLNRFMTSFFNFQRSWHDFCGSIGSIGAFEDAMETMEQNAESCEGEAVPVLQRGLEVKNLSFSFDGKKVLDRVNLAIPKNKCIAIVGESGAGKTTLLNILTGLLRPEPGGGDVFYDDKPYIIYDKLRLREKFGYVTQEAVLFDTTIENNITLWKNNSRQRLVEAAEKSHSAEFISKFSEGFSRVTGDRGTALSGGQRQRVMIARELYRNPEVLVFDEATSSLDSESEHYIQETMRSFLGRKTMVMVAHRVSSLKTCDFIYVVREGRIVEQGTWSELLGRDGYFAKIHNAQQM